MVWHSNLFIYNMHIWSEKAIYFNFGNFAKLRGFWLDSIPVFAHINFFLSIRSFFMKTAFSIWPIFPNQIYSVFGQILLYSWQHGFRLKSSSLEFDSLLSLVYHHMGLSQSPVPVCLSLPSIIRNTDTRPGLTSLALLGRGEKIEKKQLCWTKHVEFIRS